MRLIATTSEVLRPGHLPPTRPERELLTRGPEGVIFRLLNTTSKDSSPPQTPTNVSTVRKAFSDARRKALLTQGNISYEQVKANQLTMKPVP